jgi:hypothetical protein
MLNNNSRFIDIVKVAEGKPSLQEEIELQKFIDGEKAEAKKKEDQERKEKIRQENIKKSGLQAGDFVNSRGEKVLVNTSFNGISIYSSSNPDNVPVGQVTDFNVNGDPIVARSSNWSTTSFSNTIPILDNNGRNYIPGTITSIPGDYQITPTNSYRGQNLSSSQVIRTDSSRNLTWNNNGPNIF